MGTDAYPVAEPLVATVGGFHVLAYRPTPQYSARIVVAPTNTANATRETDRAMLAIAHALASRLLESDAFDALGYPRVDAADDRKVGARWYTHAIAVSIETDWHRHGHANNWATVPRSIDDDGIRAIHDFAIRVVMARS